MYQTKIYFRQYLQKCNGGLLLHTLLINHLTKINDVHKVGFAKLTYYVSSMFWQLCIIIQEFSTTWVIPTVLNLILAQMGHNTLDIQKR